MTEAQTIINIVNAVLPLGEIPLQADGNRLAFSFNAPPNLYQFSVLIDARDFDWEQLYETLNKYHNVNQRTGPWDFSINFGATPLVPAYWVTVNGKRLGLWFFERVSLEDIEHKRFRGKFAFYAEGETTVELALLESQEYIVPSLEDQKHGCAHVMKNPGQPPVFNRSGLRWLQALLEVDPEDRLEPPARIKDAQYAPAAQWRNSDYWTVLRQKLATSHSLYEQPLQRAFDWLMNRNEYGAQDILLLLVAHHVGQRPAALPRALETLDNLIAMPSFGNPNPAGYSHNGDMGAMECLRALAWAYHGLYDELSSEQREWLLKKMSRHGQIFFDLILLNRDYWGGSVAQDHGWKSLFGFGVVALNMLGILPEAQRWVGYLLPRLRRSLQAMPRDGVVPSSSHQCLYLYLDYVSQYRDALLAQTGEDIYDQPQFLPVIDYLMITLEPEQGKILTTGSDRIPLIGGAHFLNQMAGKYHDRRAAWLQTRIQEVQSPNFSYPTQVYGYYLGAVWGLMSYNPAVQPLNQIETPPRLTHFQDSGLVHYRDDERKMTLSVRCGPESGYNSYRASLCSCDRLGTVPASGHFTFYLDGVPLLCSPDRGYKLHSGLRSCLLVDGHGQYGDIGYPMSIPSKLHRGEQVQFVNWNEAIQTGLVRLWLTPSYPEMLGVAHYTRDFLLAPGRVTVRDRVVLNEPRQMSWLFQGKRDRGVALEGVTGFFGQKPQVQLTPQGLALRAVVRETDVVWSYSSANNFEPFDHVRYDTVDAVRSVVVDFVLTLVR